MRLSQFMGVEPAATVAVNSRALAMKAAGIRVYNLSAGEPMIATDQAVLKAARDAMERGETHYPPVRGVPELLDAAGTWMKRMYGAMYSKEETLVTSGGKFAIYAAVQALINPGDEAIVIAPYWVSYSGIVKLFGGNSRVITTSSEVGWKVSVEQLEAVVGDRTRLLFLNNAGNPTGVLYTRVEIEVILAWAMKHGVVVISDEVYSGLSYEGEFVSAGMFPEYKERVVIVQSCSKHFAMTGWRIGLVFAPEKLIKTLAMIQSQSTTGAATMCQWAAVQTFVEAERIMREVNNAMRKRRDVLCAALKKYFNITVSVPAGLYVFMSLEELGVKEKDSAVFCLKVLEEAHVALVPGSAFGVEGYVRLSFGEKEGELEEAIKKLAEYVRG